MLEEFLSGIRGLNELLPQIRNRVLSEIIRADLKSVLALVDELYPLFVGLRFVVAPVRVSPRLPQPRALLQLVIGKRHHRAKNVDFVSERVGVQALAVRVKAEPFQDAFLVFA